MAGFELFNRQWRVTIRDLDVSALDVAFKVTRSLKPEPNTCELQIWNLNETQRRALETLPPRKDGLTLKQIVEQSKSNSMVRIEAGYKSGTSMIYLGEVRSASSSVDGPNIITTVSTGDGEKDLQVSRIHVPIGPKTSIDVALRAIIRAIGCGEGNLDTFAAKLKLSGAAEMYVGGTVLSGSAADELDAFCKSANIEWSIQNGKLQLVDRSKALEGRAILVSADHGLIGSPSIDNKGVISFRLLMIPDMYPGRPVVFDSKALEGGYRVDSCTYVGNTAGNEWWIDCKAKIIGTALLKGKKKPKKTRGL